MAKKMIEQELENLVHLLLNVVGVDAALGQVLVTDPAIGKTLNTGQVLRKL